MRGRAEHCVGYGPRDAAASTAVLLTGASLLFGGLGVLLTVLVELTSGKKLVMTTQAPAAMAAAIQEALDRRDRKRPAVRIAEAAEAEPARGAEARSRAGEADPRADTVAER